MTTQRIQISDLFQGSSNQHPAKRRPGQVDAAQNIRFDIGDGATRRNGTDLLDDLPALLVNGDYQHFQFLERFLVSIAPAGILIHDMRRSYSLDNAVPVPVIDTAGNFNYLASATSSKSFRVAGLLETLVILNRDATTSFTTSPDYSVAGEVLTFDRLFEAPDEGVSPLDAAIGEVWEVLEDWVETRAGFYLRGEEDGETTWTLTAPPNDPNAIPDPATLPHRLVYDEDNSRFIYEPCPWRDRLSGTNATNPAPSWAGEKIKAIASHQGRLMLISGDYITSGEIVAPRRSAFNLYDYNIDAPSDADRIEIAITDATLGEPLHALSVGLDLVLLCRAGVDLFTSGRDSLTATNGRDYKILSVPCSEVPPATGAGEAFFADNTGLIHWLLYSDGGIKHQGRINDHRRDLLNGKVLESMWLVDQTLFLVAGSITQVLSRYVIPSGTYQEAWGGYKFFEPAKGFFSVEAGVRVLCKHGPVSGTSYGYSLLDLNERQPNLLDSDYEICLDRRERVTGVYEASKDRTRFVHTGRPAGSKSVIVLVQADGSWAMQPVSPSMIEGNRIYIQGDWSGGTHWIGFSYSSSLDLSALWAGASTLMPLLSELNVIHKGSTDYLVQVRQEGEEFFEDSPWTAAEVGVAQLGELLPETGISTHLVLGDARYTSIRISSNSAGYFAVPAIEYRYRLRGKS